MWLVFSIKIHCLCWLLHGLICLKCKMLSWTISAGIVTTICEVNKENSTTSSIVWVTLSHEFARGSISLWTSIHDCLWRGLREGSAFCTLSLQNYWKYQHPLEIFSTKPLQFQGWCGNILEDKSIWFEARVGKTHSFVLWVKKLQEKDKIWQRKR